MSIVPFSVAFQIEFDHEFSANLTVYICLFYLVVFMPVLRPRKILCNHNLLCIFSLNLARICLKQKLLKTKILLSPSLQNWICFIQIKTTYVITQYLLHYVIVIAYMSSRRTSDLTFLCFCLHWTIMPVSWIIWYICKSKLVYI